MLIVFALIGSKTQAQITFVKFYSNANGYSVQQTSDGGYIMTGSNYYNYTHINLIKTNANGDTLWTRTYGHDLGDYDIGYSVQQTNDGGYIIVATIASSNTSPIHLYLIKTNSTGDTLWTKTYGSTGNDYGYSVKQTLDSGFIIAGATDSLGAGGYDAFLIKTNSIGDTLWTKTYGGINDDEAKSVELTTDGGYIITGYTNSFGAGDNDVYLIKTDSIGDTLWTKTFGSVNYDIGYSVRQTSDGGFILVGTYNLVYFCLIKTNSIGDTLWTKNYYANVTNNNAQAYSVQQTIDGGYIFAGTAGNWVDGTSQSMLIKTNSMGDTLWTKYYSDGINFVQQSTDGGYIVTGESSLIKTDSTGNSGCRWSNSSISLYSFPTLISNTSTIIKSGCMVSSPSEPVGSGGTFVITRCFSAGINEIKTIEDISIFPNPASNLITISLPATNIKSCSINLYDMLGEKMLPSYSTYSTQTTIDLSSIPQGIYFLEVMMDNEKVVRKVVKM